MFTLNLSTASRIIQLLAIFGPALVAREAMCREPVQETEEYKFVEAFFRNNQPEPVPQETIRQERELAEKFARAPDKFVKAIIMYHRVHREKLAQMELAGFFFFYLGAAYVLNTNPHLARAELVKYLELDKQGNLRVMIYDETDGNQDDAALAYHLLWFLDHPWNGGGAPSERPELVRPVFLFTHRRPYGTLVRPVSDAYDSYARIIQSYGDNVPPALVQYLFQEFPFDAWHYFAEATKDKSRLTAEDFCWTVHVLMTTAWRMINRQQQFAELDLARKELQRLVDDTAWYSRRFAVQVLLSYPFFRTPELVKKLQNDPHPLVRERAKHIKLDPAQQK